LKGHKQRIYQFAFFDNDTKIASVSWDKTINIWDISSLSENSDRTTILKPERTLKEFPGCEILSFKDKVLRLSDGTILDTSKIKQQIEKLKKQCQVTLQNNTQFIHHDNMFDTINWPPHHPFLDQYQS
jgi:WD40 repeat protein